MAEKKRRNEQIPVRDRKDLMDQFFKKFTLEKKQGNGFFLTPIELKDYIYFEPKRIYYLTNVGAPTGQHIHFEEKELFVMIKGKCTAIIDKGNGREEMDFGTNDALYVPNYVWHGFKDFDDDSIMMAITSTNYNPDRTDYLEDYDKYIEIRDEKLSEIYGI